MLCLSRCAQLVALGCIDATIKIDMPITIFRFWLFNGKYHLVVFEGAYHWLMLCFAPTKSALSLSTSTAALPSVSSVIRLSSHLFVSVSTNSSLIGCCDSIAAWLFVCLSWCLCMMCLTECVSGCDHSGWRASLVLLICVCRYHSGTEETLAR